MKPPFELNSLRWRMERDSRSLRLLTVEPHFYRPAEHTGILFAALARLKGGESAAYREATERLAAPSFDLIVFPEVFLPADALVSLVETLGNVGPTGCIHTGLRPDICEQFLFTHNQTVKLTEALISAGAYPDDLKKFSVWLTKQPTSAKYNLGAVVAVDCDGKVRVAVHPKVVRSKYEISALAELHMTEAKFLTLIKLVPTDSRLLPITLQPLLCSDALCLDSSCPEGRPIDVISRFGEELAGDVPDQIDIISLATCSPHPDSVSDRMVHQEFRDSFIRMSKDEANLRHRHAMALIANFGHINNTLRHGGLSGAFLPTPLPQGPRPSYVIAPQFAVATNENDVRWHITEGTLTKPRAHMICLRTQPENTDAVATLFGFDLDRMIKETNQYHIAKGLSNYEHLICYKQPDGTFLFL